MSAETRSTLLHEQVQERLKVSLMWAPAVSDALNYQLFIATKNEERQ